MDTRWEKHTDESLAKLVEKIVLDVELPAPFEGAESRADLAALKKTGSELWLDTGDREVAAKNWTADLSGLTTNNTLANQVVQKGTFDGVIKRAIDELKQSDVSLDDDGMVIEVGFAVNAAISRTLVGAFGTRVSVELHPALANDVDATVMFAKRYFAIDPENFYIKVPLTPAGVIAVRRLSETGIPVNFTLGFSARQNHLLARISRPAYVNVFLGRDNQVVIENKLGDGKNIGEKATLASQKDVTQAREAGLTETKQIAASLRAADQVQTLAGVDVHTIPPGVLEKFCATNIDPADLSANLDADLPVDVKDEGVNVLWEISDKFRSMTESLAKEDVSKMTPQQLVASIRDGGVPDLFGDYSSEDWNAIRSKGKIPDLSHWKGRDLALDNLMTVSALEAFAKDQEELDSRIAGFIKK